MRRVKDGLKSDADGLSTHGETILKCQHMMAAETRPPNSNDDVVVSWLHCVTLKLVKNTWMVARYCVAVGVQGGSGAWGDQGVAVHHPDQEDISH